MSFAPPVGVAEAAEPRTAQATRTQPASGGGYLSRPDLVPTPLLVTESTGREDPGLLLTTPFGPDFGPPTGAIYDNTGELVWQGRDHYSNLQQIVYEGEPALAALTGGRAVVLDSGYDEIASFGMRGYDLDFHTLEFNEDGTRALLAAYVTVPHDLSPYGGPADARVVDAVIQEVDTATGGVTFEWSALDHVRPDETHQPLTGPHPVDYFHVNSVAYDSDGNLLVSARHTSTIYKLDIDTGRVLWRFGGENSDFALPDRDDAPSHQHDALRLRDGRLAAFDNGVSHRPRVSRGAAWELDEETMTAELVRDLQPRPPLFGEFMGSQQPTPNGNQLVSFGTAGHLVEFDGDRVVFRARFPGTYTYKAERTDDWVGRPTAPPDVVWTAPDEDGERTLHMSWNGATEVDRWRVEAARDGRGDGGRSGGFRPVETVERTGFETTAEVTTDPPGTAWDVETLRVSALAEDGEVLGTRLVTEGVDAPVDPAAAPAVGAASGG
ncbi:arylsulfotransferase family protein [Streptomyces sp. 4N509B]|uniref:arylsulfotransferase family protein n=1 Tax=Streptomyces sp. 4N509B TaxID=3457413 RepID=UPI003FD16916